MAIRYTFNRQDAFMAAHLPDDRRPCALADCAPNAGVSAFAEEQIRRAYSVRPHIVEKKPDLLAFCNFMTADCERTRRETFNERCAGFLDLGRPVDLAESNALVPPQGADKVLRKGGVQRIE